MKHTNTFGRVILRVARQDDSRKQAAYDVADVIGGTPRIWGKRELLVEDAGPGIHLHIQHNGNVMELEGGSTDYDGISEWLEGVAATLKRQVPRELKVSDRTSFADILCSLLGGSEAGCTVRNDTVVVGSLPSVKRSLRILFGKSGKRVVSTYFGARMPSRKRM